MNGHGEVAGGAVLHVGVVANLVLLVKICFHISSTVEVQ
jgi:hypothetical protein